MSVIDQGLTPVVWEAWQLDLLEAAAAARRMPAASLAVHLEIDTGMSRQGVRIVGSHVSAEATSLLNRFHPSSCLRLEGVMTHFCTPEEFSSTQPNPQLARLGAGLRLYTCAAACGRSGCMRAIRRASSRDPTGRPCWRWHRGWGRARCCAPGLALYGYLDRFTRDGSSWDAEDADFAPVLTWKTQVTSLRTLLGRRDGRLWPYLHRDPGDVPRAAAGGLRRRAQPLAF